MRTNNLPILSNEPKGILLGIIAFISTHLNNLKSHTIQINLSKYIIPLSKLFEDKNIKWIHTTSNLGPNSPSPDFTICIQTQLLGDLNIRSLELIDKLYTDKVELLPWSDPDNPILMFKTNSKKKQDVQKIKSKITNLDPSHLNNQELETQILKLYFSRTNAFAKFDTLIKYYAQLYAQTLKSSSSSNSQLSNLPVPNYMPIVFSTSYKQQVEQIKEMIAKKETKYRGFISSLNSLNSINSSIDMTQSHNQTQYQPQSHNQTQYQPQSHNQTQYQPQSHNQTQYQPQSHNQTQSQSHNQSQPQVQPQSHNQTQPQVQPQVQLQYKSRVIDLEKEINDLRKIIDLLNTNIQLLDSNTTSALGYNQNNVQSGGSKDSSNSIELNKLLRRATKLSNKMYITKKSIYY